MARQKWEYCEIYEGKHWTKDAKGKDFYATTWMGKVHKRGAGWFLVPDGDLQAYIGVLGLDGWELVSVSHDVTARMNDATVSRPCYYFKKLVE